MTMNTEHIIRDNGIASNLTPHSEENLRPMHILHLYIWHFIFIVCVVKIFPAEGTYVTSSNIHRAANLKVQKILRLVASLFHIILSHCQYGEGHKAASLLAACITIYSSSYGVHLLEMNLHHGLALPTLTTKMEKSSMATRDYLHHPAHLTTTRSSS